MADIPQAGRTQQSIHDGMDDHIGIRMAQQAFFIRNIYAAQNQLTIRHQLMDIISLSYPHCASSHETIASPISRSNCVVILIFVRSPTVSVTTLPICSTAEQSSVSGIFFSMQW